MKHLVLILVLVVGLFGSELEKIGVPYVGKTIGKIDSAVLAIDGKRFYTLKDGLVTHWQLEPLKRLDSFKTGIQEPFCKPLKPQYHISTCNISVSSNEKKMIIRSNKSLLLFDLEKKVLIEKINHESLYGVMDSHNYMTFDTNNWVTHNNTATLWKIDKGIKEVKKIIYKGAFEEADEDESQFDDSLKSVLILDNMIIVFANDDISMYDKDTFEILDMASRHRGNAPYLNYNYKFIDYYKSLKRINLYKTDKTFEPGLRPFRIKLSSFMPLVSISKHLTLSLTRDFHAIFFIPPKTLKQRRPQYGVKFYQFSDGEAILMGTNGGKNITNHFELTSNSKKYLTMKISVGKIVPINDETFNKYKTKFKF